MHKLKVLRINGFVCSFISNPSAHDYQPTLAYQVTVGVGVSSPIEGRQGSPVRGKGSKGTHEGSQQNQRQPLLHLLGDTNDDQAAHQLHMYRGPRSVPYLLFSCFSLFEPL